MEKLYEHSTFLINRYDHYFDTVNNKGQFYLGLNTFLIGGLGAAYLLLRQQQICSNCLDIMLVLLFSISFVSIFFTLRAILPYLKSGNKPTYTSIIFFGSVASLTQEQFVQKTNTISEADLENDLIIQTYQLAKGLAQKFERLKFAGFFLALEFFLLIPFLIILFINIK
jgi:hypothetical protein